MWLLARCRGLKVIIDPTGSAVTDRAGVHSTADPTGVTWPEEFETVRFVPERPYDLELYNRIYRTLRQGLLETRRWRQVTVLCDEAETVMPVNRCPEEAAGFVYAGRKWGTGHISCFTRPRNIAMCLKANITNAALFPLPDKEDRATVAANIGVPRTQLEELWSRLPPETKSFLWWDQAARSIRPVHSQPR